MYRHGGKQRHVLLLWFLLCLIIIPSGTLTRLFEWTGVPLELGSMTVYLTLYIPMLFCVPLVMWLGYWWAAIPAYLSTFAVALLGGMPIGWIIVFSLANPLGLAMYAMFYRVTPMRTDLRGLESLVGFIFIALVASLAGSIGAFIWALTNNVGLNVAHPVWLGWWLGGWLQTIIIVAPILYFFGPGIDRNLKNIRDSFLHLNNSRPAMISMITSFFLVLVCYVGAGRVIGLQQMRAVDWPAGDTMSFLQAQNIVDSLSYPLFILLAVIIALFYLAYRAVVFWQATLSGVNEKLTLQNEQLIRLVNTDPLSGLLNRRRVFEQLAHEFNRSSRAQKPMSIIMIDADKFKSINDSFGHLVGDKVIKMIANKIKQSLRNYDIAGRYGGEEFIAVLPYTSQEEALLVADRIRTEISSEQMITETGRLNVTVSLGVASLSELDKDADSIIDRADKALLRAKNEGRNRLELG